MAIDFMDANGLSTPSGGHKTPVQTPENVANLTTTAHSAALEARKDFHLSSFSSIPPLIATPEISDVSGGGMSLGPAIKTASDSAAGMATIAESITNSVLTSMGIFSPADSLPVVDSANIAFVDSFQQEGDDDDAMEPCSANKSVPDPRIQQ